jgi:hypothetical protein
MSVEAYAVLPIPITPEQLRELGNKITEGANKAVELGDHVIDRARDSLRAMAADGVISIIKFEVEVNERLYELRDQIVKFFNLVVDLSKGIAFPVKAFFLGIAWADSVKKPISSLKAVVSDANLEVDDYWTGPAAEAYKSAVQGQMEAMGEVMAIADEVKYHLWALAGLMLAFYATLAAFIIRIVKDLRAALAASTTGWGAIAGIALFVNVIKKSREHIGKLSAAASALIGGEVQAFYNFRQRVQTSDKFPHGHWPQVTTSAMRDGSLQDGDDTDWHTKAQ